MLSRLLFIAPIFLGACASPYPNSFTSDRDIEKAVVGSWQCTAEFGDDKRSLDVETVDSYAADGTYKSAGPAFVSFQVEGEYIELKYWFGSFGTWKAEDGELLLASEDLRLTILSHPGIEEVFDLNDSLPQSMAGPASIIELTEDNLVLSVDSNLPPVMCVRLDG
ncbi:hypothetical protein [Marinobacter adhaerens]|jgi:hypothetical protein|uniref:hypothetical protein n=1 Tax=Marinobacter adhaerens TaxID=1033846 RepID=UPI001E61F564|nr:hypothetical protein [Marinobacter adhaerens]MCD1649106.1 hypothetical protein [Marinobacter adhaerens]